MPLLCLLRFLCLLTSWTCMGTRVCPNKLCPSATPALPTCPTSKGNTLVSSTTYPTHTNAAAPVTINSQIDSQLLWRSTWAQCTWSSTLQAFVLWLCTTEMSLNIFASTLHIDENWWKFFFIVSQSPAIMHMLDKSGSCGKFENYQRPEGFPVGMCG